MSIKFHNTVRFSKIVIRNSQIARWFSSNQLILSTISQRKKTGPKKAWLGLKGDQTWELFSILKQISLEDPLWGHLLNFDLKQTRDCTCKLSVAAN